MCNDSLLQPRSLSNDNHGDNSVAISKKPDERERFLRFYLGQLRENAGLCSRATNVILQGHVQLSYLMAQRMDDMSSSQFMGLNYDDSETTRLANDISQASRELSLYVTRMNDNLNSFVSTVEKIQETRKEQTLVEWILEWLKSLFKALARIFVTFGPIITPFLHSIAPNASWVEPAASTLYVAARTFCIATSSAFLEHTFPCKKEVIYP